MSDTRRQQPIIGHVDIKLSEGQDIPLVEFNWHPQLLKYAIQLLSTGLYGRSLSDVITQLVESGIRQALKDGIIANRDTKGDDRPRCTNCGSPNLAQGLTMGAGIECMDCGTAQ